MEKPSKAKTPSRRTFLNRSAILAVGAVALPRAGVPSTHQSPANPVVDLSREKIVQFSIVVRDREAVAKRFEQIFGVAWRFYDFRPKRILLQNGAPADGNCYLKIAIGSLGGRSLKLVQPVSGQSSYAEFLKKNGEGFYTIGLGTMENHDRLVAALKQAGVAVEMQGDLGNGAKFSILGTADDLGCRLELSSPAKNANESNLIQTGKSIPAGLSFVEVDKPAFSGGKKLNQVGIVVGDEKKAAKRFEELLGIGNWKYSYGPPGLINAFLNGKSVKESEMQSLDVAFANGWLGDIQIEIIRPIGIRPGGCHQVFLDRHGNGIQHVSFGLQADYAAVVEGLQKAGIGSEFSASIKARGVTACYFATQSQLGGFQLEIVGRTEA
jgi:hypothetical protein